MTTSNDRPALSAHRSRPTSAARMARFVAIALGLTLTMGQTDCGNTTDDGEVLPNRVLIEAPMLTIDTNGNEREEPYLVSFNWEATSRALGSGNGFADYDFEGINQGPWPYRLDARNGERMLIGEDVGKVDMHFPDVPANLTEARSKHVKIGGLTLCAFEADDPNGQSSFKTEVEKFAVALTSGLSAAYSSQLYGDDSTRAAFRSVYQQLITETETAWLALDDEEREESEPLYESLLEELADAIKRLDIEDKQVVQKVGAGTVLGYVGTAFEVLPNLISLFKRKRKPDPDDFVGCASMVYVGVPHDVWKEQSASGFGTCDAGTGGGSQLAVCAIDRTGPTTLVFAPPIDQQEPSRRWFTQIDVRRGNSPFDEDGELANQRSAYKYATVGSNRSETVPMPDVDGPSKLCDSGVSGECRIHFAHMVNYATHSRGRHSFEITEKPANNYEISVVGEATQGSVGVRLSTFVLPDYVRVHRQTVSLDASGKDESDIRYIPYPSWYSPSKGVMITEILSVQQQGGKFAGVNHFARDITSTRQVHLLLRRFGQYPPPYSTSGEMKAKVRLTFLSWDDSTKVDVSNDAVLSDDNIDAPPQFPEFTEIDWFMPFAAHQTSATLYFPRELMSTRDWPETAFSVRAVGAEVRDFDKPKIRVYAQHAYAGYRDDRPYVIGRVVNMRFK